MQALSLVVHVGVAAIWLGAMAYSLGVVQPRARRFFGDARRYEDFAVTLAAGARWKVVGMIAALAASGAVLWLLEDDPGAAWLALVVAKAAALVAATLLFAHVSWRLWPRRLFAAPDELEALQRRFLGVAMALTGLAGGALVLGAVAAAL